MKGSIFFLGIVLLVLKLCAVAPVATLSWWLVLLPFYFPYFILAIFSVALFIFAFSVLAVTTIISLFE